MLTRLPFRSLLLALAVALFGCGSQAADESAATAAEEQPASDAEDVTTLLAGLAAQFPDEAELVDHLAERAADEGRATMYTAVHISIIEPLIEAFDQRYPDVEVDFVRMDHVPLVERLRSEDRAGRAEADVVVSVGLPLAELRADGLIADHHGVPVPEKFPDRYVGDWAVTNYLTPEVFAWNTDRRIVSEPITWQQLASDEVEGCAIYPQADGIIAAMLDDRGKAAAGEWLGDFVAGGPRPHETRSSVPPALASGELECTVDTLVHWVEALRAEGAPVDWQALDPVPATTVSVALHAQTERPYAAILFMHWLLAEEAAGIIADSGRIPVWPGLDLETPRLERFVDPEDELAESALLLTPEFMLEAEPTIRRLREEHLAPLADGQGS